MPHFIFIQQISVLNILNMLYNLYFFSSKCRLFYNATWFGFCITHILNTGCAKIWKKKIRRQKVNFLDPSRPRRPVTAVLHLATHVCLRQLSSHSRFLSTYPTYRRQPNCNPQACTQRSNQSNSHRWHPVVLINSIKFLNLWFIISYYRITGQLVCLTTITRPVTVCNWPGDGRKTEPSYPVNQ